jgi:lactoylglutathione lyase
MATETKTATNVQQAVPFFAISKMEVSLRFYIDGLGFEMTNKWTPDGDGRIRWCWLQLGNAAIMLQEYRDSKKPEGKLGTGVTICFQCKDALALYREFMARGIDAKRPFVGNGLWVTSAQDPDGYKLEFASPTDAPEESLFSEA